MKPGLLALATFSPDASDGWTRTVLVNLVPDQGKQEHGYQAGPDNDPAGSLKFPYREWVKVTMYLDLTIREVDSEPGTQGE